MYECYRPCLSLFFFNDTATTEIYTLSLHDALPISRLSPVPRHRGGRPSRVHALRRGGGPLDVAHEHRSEEHTSELQSHSDLVCRLLLEKKINTNTSIHARRKLFPADLS